MPLVKIDVIRDAWSPSELTKLADVIQQVMQTHFNAPARDRYQIITQHEDYELVCEDSGLGFTRTKKLVIIQILQQGRSAAQKQQVFKELSEKLQQNCSVSGQDLIISCAENTHADWSFGMGIAQFMTGEL
ncbi:Tautomerase/MIF superfamily [Penicillium angulare]|uniref:Tautomerase/MIF superfamily n=1 Tax=Penicillium angulare TaxID=116970 RepID=A0A9W9KPK5_9EURO|nr:Tautomerase/MIF superfamily [Penicillium angulare]